MLQSRARTARRKVAMRHRSARLPCTARTCTAIRRRRKAADAGPQTVRPRQQVHRRRQGAHRRRRICTARSANLRAEAPERTHGTQRRTTDPTGPTSVQRTFFSQRGRLSRTNIAKDVYRSMNQGRYRPKKGIGQPPRPSFRACRRIGCGDSVCSEEMRMRRVFCSEGAGKVQGALPQKSMRR